MPVVAILAGEKLDIDGSVFVLLATDRVDDPFSQSPKCHFPRDTDITWWVLSICVWLDN